MYGCWRRYTSSNCCMGCGSLQSLLHDFRAPNVMEKRNFKIEINQLQSGLYKIKHYTLDKENGALYRVWQQHNTTYGMDQETIDYVNRISYPKLDIAEVEVEETLTYHLKVMTNSIHIIEVNKYV